MLEASGLMRGKRGLIMGVANNRSLAWGIAKACRAHGAHLAFTYQGDALKKRVEPLAQEVGGVVVGDCDVTEPKTIDAIFAAVQSALRFRTRINSMDAISTRRRTTSPKRC
jgi:enoyl-[acyl-carrier protein] reductase I